MNTKFCGMCGSKMEEGQKFCKACGWNSSTIINKSNPVPTELPFSNERSQGSSFDSNIYPYTTKVSSKKPLLLVLAIIVISAIAISLFVLRSNFIKPKADTPTKDLQISADEISGTFTGNLKVTNMKNIESAELSEDVIAKLKEMKNTPSSCKLIIEDNKIAFSFDINGEEDEAPPMTYEFLNGEINAALNSDNNTFKLLGHFGRYKDRLTLNGSYIYSYPITEEKSVVIEFSFITLEYKQ